MLTVAVTPVEALADYLALGAQRSIRLLHQKYMDEINTKAPCLRTLLTWSGRYRWSAAAADHDRAVAEQRQGMAEEALALLRQLEQRRRGGEILVLRKSSPPNGDAI